MKFWNTTYGILIKRVLFSILATAVTLLADELKDGVIMWSQYAAALQIQVGYIITTFVRDLSDKTIPNK